MLNYGETAIYSYKSAYIELQAAYKTNS